jgi:uncharacterized membrane protein YagU involved in acid resistance
MNRLARAVAAGVIGTTAMTAAQVLPSKLRSGGEGNDSPPSWDNAPVPALVAKKIGEKVFGRQVSAEKIPLLTNVMHWGYGTTWGVLYGLAHARGSEHPLRRGVAFGIGVWTMSYVQLVPMGLYEPPWKYSPKELAPEIGYHLAFGTGVAVGHRALA